MLKVSSEGQLVFAQGHLTIANWGFYDPRMAPGETRDANDARFKKEVVRAVLDHLAAKAGVQLTQSEPTEHFTLDTERAALDIIAQVRWTEKE